MPEEPYWGMPAKIYGIRVEKVVAMPIPMILTCPSCGQRHIDQGEFATKVHHTHACQHCGIVWRPAIEPTVGVQFLPGFKDEEKRGIIDPSKLDVKK